MFSQPTGALVELLCFDQFEALTSSHEGHRDSRAGGWGEHVPPNYFLNYRVSMKVSCAFPTPKTHTQISSHKVTPSPKSQSCSAVPGLTSGI